MERFDIGWPHTETKTGDPIAYRTSPVLATNGIDYYVPAAKDCHDRGWLPLVFWRHDTYFFSNPMWGLDIGSPDFCATPEEAIEQARKHIVDYIARYGLGVKTTP